MFADRRSPSANAKVGRCSSCSRFRETFELDGERIRMCTACIASVVEEAGALESIRDRLYEDAGWSWWAKVHELHRIGVVGCPLCGMAPA